jgi:diaminohydroxyphosphoribosylaminopyrimidine deaminase/5-amino-6-(5-phosphoribosylamino)uracil reductase
VRLTGADADRYFHRQRAEIDAIAVGSGTVLADDPELTARGAYRFRPLTRVIFDWRGRVPETARVFTTVEAGPVIMVVSRSAAAAQAERFQRMSRRGVAILDSEARDVAAVLTRLARREIVSLLVEGGPRLHAEFAEANAIDRVQHVITPHRLTEGIPAAPTVPDALRPPGREKRLGDDILMEFDVHRID